LEELKARHEEDRVAKEKMQVIQKAIAAGKTSQAPVGGQNLSDLEAQAARFRSV
jgi:hypothetical protein